MSSQLPPMDVPGRIPRLRERLVAPGCDAVVVTNLNSMRYLTGFTGSAGLVLVTPDDALLVTDGRYGEQAPDQITESRAPVRLAVTTLGQREAAAAASTGCRRIALEAASVSWSRQRSFASEWFPHAELVPTESLVEDLRLVKDAGEVARIEAAATIADAAFAAVRHRLLDGPTESEFGLELDTEMRRRGASERSFETIVASGRNGSRPHGRPGSRRIAPGDLVIVDFGAVVDGYRSDMTRTTMVGEPSATQSRLLEVVTAAQAAGVAAVAPGVACSDVDHACRSVVGEAGWGEFFVHGTGHGVGLDIHEAPWVNARSGGTLAAGHVVTVEPGVYLPELGGVRVEDTVLVTETGARPLTRAPKDPVLARHRTPST